jgi:predicted glycosyltransferase
MMNPQAEVECALIRGERLTALDIQNMCHPHTMDGRRIISRLQKRFNLIGQHIHSEKLNGNKYTTYWLVHSTACCGNPQARKENFI